MGAGFVFYAVVDAEGNPRRRIGKSTSTRGLMIYSDLGQAKKQCREGDAVVEMTLDLGREPLYIRSRKNPDDGDA